MIYPITATTLKNISQMNYSLYSAIDVNQLKQNHDSSSAVRLLSCLTDVSKEVSLDREYQIRFDLKNIDFINIDRLNGFDIKSIPGFSVDNEDERVITGYSNYTDTWYVLEQVSRRNEFIRQSFPADVFLSSEVDVGNSISQVLYPKKKIAIDMIVNDSAITIRPVSGFNLFNLESEYPIVIRVFGINVDGDEVVEDIPVYSSIDYFSDKEYMKINHMMVLNSQYSIEIEVMPYISGSIVTLDAKYFDREQRQEYECILSVNKEDNTLDYNILREHISEYPFQYERVKYVDIDIPDGETIIEEYIDVPSKLLYLLTDNTENKTLRCYPLIIPKTENPELDEIKTREQAIRVEYYEDCTTNNFVFYVFPVSKTGDISYMHILIDDEVYESDILLDLIRENIETNRFEIPFSDIFTDEKETATISFKTYGDKQTVQPVFVDRTKLKELWAKSLSEINYVFKEAPEEEAIEPSIFSTKAPYNTVKIYGYGEEGYSGDIQDSDTNYGYGGYVAVDKSSLMKLSNHGSVLLGGIKIINIFNTFYYDEDDGTIITSDTITHLSSQEQSWVLAFGTI